MAKILNAGKGMGATSAADKDATWKADGFINVSIPDAEGRLRKLGAIPLRDVDDSQKELREWLQDEEKQPARLAKLLASLVLDYKDAAPKQPVRFALLDD